MMRVRREYIESNEASAPRDLVFPSRRKVVLGENGSRHDKARSKWARRQSGRRANCKCRYRYFPDGMVSPFLSRVNSLESADHQSLRIPAERIFPSTRSFLLSVLLSVLLFSPSERIFYMIETTLSTGKFMRRTHDFFD